MRRAKFRDRLEEARSSQRQTVLESLSFKNIEGLRDGELHLSPFLTTIVGGNGVGKSTLLCAIHCLIDPSSIEHAAFRSRRLKGAELRGTFATPTGKVVVTRCFDADGGHGDPMDAAPSLECRFVELARDARRLVDWAKKDGLEEKIQGLAPRLLRPRQLDEVRALVRKDYSAVRVFEVEEVLDPSDPDSPTTIMPYFRVAVHEGGGSEYGSENMGLGETMLLTAHWHLSAQRSNELLLIEECDSHIPDFSKDALFERIVEYAARTKASVVITTHSSRMVSTVPPDSLRVVVREQSGSSIYPDPELLLTRRSLDISSQVELIVLCEDQVAAMLAKAIVAKFAPAAISACEFTIAGADSRLISVLRNFPNTVASVRLLGVLDGDQRAAAIADLLWPCVFLPGEIAPDEWIRRVVSRAQVPVAQSLGIDPAALSASLNPFVGIDHHDWMERWPASIARSPDEVVRAVLQVCEGIPDELLHARVVADKVVELLRIHELMVHSADGSGSELPANTEGNADLGMLNTGSVLELLQLAGVEPSR